MYRDFNFKEIKEIAGGKSLKTGEISCLSGISIESLRFYEKSGWLDRPGRRFGCSRWHNSELQYETFCDRRKQNMIEKDPAFEREIESRIFFISDDYLLMPETTVFKTANENILLNFPSEDLFSA